MKTFKRSLSLIILFIFASIAYAQSNTYIQRFNNGAALYNMGRYYDAGIEFRRAQETASNENDWAAAIYWVILSELAYSDYGSALLDMENLERKAPDSIYNRDMAYHRGRIYFNQGYFENALLLFRRYIDSVTETTREAEDRKAAAFYWMGECLFAMGQFDEAERFYTWVVDTYPESPKREISSYRIDLIRQKKIEAELLALLQWSHEESLRTSEEYQRRIRTYEYTLNAYQRRITELSQGNESYVSLPAEEYIHPPENRQPEVPPAPYIPPADYTENSNNHTSNHTQDSYTIDHHENLIEKARQLGIELEQLIKEYEYGASSW